MSSVLPGCVCGEINSRHCTAHSQDSIPLSSPVPRCACIGRPGFCEATVPFHHPDCPRPEALRVRWREESAAMKEERRGG